MHKPRLLLISHELTRSGAPLLLFMTAKYLQRRGFSPYLLCPVDGPLREEYARSGINIHITPHILRDARVGLAWCQRSDLVLANTILSWRIVFSARAVGVPCFWWVHESNFGVNLVHKHPEIAEALEAATRVIFPSKYTSSQYLPFASGVNFIALHSGIDAPAQLPGSVPLIYKAPGECHLVSVATIEKRKGQDILLSAVETLPPQISRFVHLHLVGRGSIDKGFYRKIQVRSFLKKNIRIWGELSQERAFEVLRAADVFVLASRDEALPVSLLEAMALGKPIISTNAGGISEAIISGDNGLLVNVADVSALRNAIIHLFQNPDLQQKLGERAKQDFFSGYTVDVMGEKFYEILNREGGRRKIDTHCD